MTKSRIVFIALAIGCFAMLGAGTAAYFTAQDTAINVITTGILDATLVEKTTDGAEPDTKLEDLPEFKSTENGAFNVMPGQTVSKIPYVANTGTADFYTRIRLTATIVDKNGKAMDAETVEKVLSLDIKPDVWVFKDGWYYYTQTVAAKSRTEPLFTGVSFDAAEMGNEYQNAAVIIDVDAQAVQSNNNGESWREAIGWPEAE